MNTLLIVEGEKYEAELFRKINSLFHIEGNIIAVKSNIYRLYRELQKYDFNADIRNVLRSMRTVSEEDKNKLSQTFGATYLIYDCDAHAREESEKACPLLDIIFSNMDRLREMSNYFVNETDPAVGKLYINYPMMESLRYANDFFDDDYQTARVECTEIPNFKELASFKRLSSKHVDNYTKENVIDLCRMSIYKLNYIINGTWSAPSYDQYRNMMDNNSLFDFQNAFVHDKLCMWIVNSSIMLITDYYGNSNSVYDNLIAGDSNL